MTRPVDVRCHAPAADTIRTYARLTVGIETGGILLGWWEPHTIVIIDAVEIPDTGATTTSWQRQQDTAQDALDRALHHHGNPLLGYVGDWHTHPRPSQPSPADLAAIARASRQFDDPLALLVHLPSGAFATATAHDGRQRSARLMLVGVPRLGGASWLNSPN